MQVGETLLKILVDDASSCSASDNQEMQVTSELCESQSQMRSPKVEASGAILSTPAVRNFAKQYGININEIYGTGKDGRVLKEDVLKFAASKGVCKETPILSHAHVDECINEFELLKERKSFHANIEDAQMFEDKIIALR